jgi:APA family basic amino acid/polyamine antiporter
MQGQIPAAAAADELLPRIFARENKSKTPVFSLVASSLLVSALIFMNYQKSLASAFEFAMLLSTLSILISYLFSVIAFLIRGRTPGAMKWKPIHLLVATVAFIFSVIAVIGSGADIVFWGFLLLIAGLPVYAWMKTAKSPDP